ncbi:unnamed protein product [Cylindrotheca closterium]|uniref:DNA recombination and repair protein Rad51-like C-terminal domain-containing protein n=1 Tax=Cylindrotheca closterium TaxID=2856 RepID=A0AAD2GAN1_9STRA|nr:unnamed protein product [Cylindrotheca closterium]
MASYTIRGRRDRGVAPKSAWAMLRQQQQQQQQQSSSSSSSTRLPLHLANHPSFPLHLGVNALAGPAGSGKTQLCLSLVADCVLWRKQKAVFVSLGKDTTVRISQRLHSMLKHRTFKENRVTPDLNNSDMDKFIKQEYLTKIFVNWVRNQDDLFHMLCYGLPKLLKEQQDGIHDASSNSSSRISLVVLDGIATLFRQKEKGQSWVDRSAHFFQIASICQRLSHEHQVPFVFTNEATCKLSNSDSSIGGLLASSQLEPALGLSWAQCINSSYFVQKQQGYDHHQSSNNNSYNNSNNNNNNNNKDNNKRVLKCIKSPHMDTNVKAEFAIEQRGIVRIIQS